MKIISQEFVVSRTKATRDVQAILVNPPYSYVWEAKTVVLWNDDIAVLDQYDSAESLARTEWRNAAEVWDADLRGIQEFTRDVAGYGVRKFRNDPTQLLPSQARTLDVAAWDHRSAALAWDQYASRAPHDGA